MADNKLDITESSDFHYLLELLPLLYETDEYQWLPELFSIVGYERLINLARYAGGETVKIPTVEQLSTSLEALDWYYKVYVAKKKRIKSVPLEYSELVAKIKETIDARYNKM